MSRFGRAAASTSTASRSTAFFFDILHLDDDDLLDAPLAERLDALAPIAGERAIPSRADRRSPTSRPRCSTTRSPRATKA